MKACLVRTCLALTALLLSMLGASAQGWSGDWDSNFGQLRLLQDRDRLHGDYQERGAIEGRISPDGRSARAFFVYTDGRWGMVQWRLAGDKLSGTWNWAADGLPDPKAGKSWTATRTSLRTSPLKFSDQFSLTTPRDDSIHQEPILSWRSFADAGSYLEPNKELSALYGGYALSGINPVFDIGADVIHYEDADTATVDLSAFVRTGRCPAIMHTSLCRDLQNAVDSRGFVPIETTGVLITDQGRLGEAIAIAFRLDGDTQDRLLHLRREATYFSAAIWHPSRGLEYEGFAQGRSHLCEQTQCSNAVFEDVQRNPDSYRGTLSLATVAGMLRLPNSIAASHGITQHTPNGMMGDAWAILDETSENLGEVTFSPDGPRLAASGVLRSFFETDTDHDTVFTLASQTNEAVAFDLVTYAGQSGENKSGTLMVELPSFAQSTPRGTLIVGDEVLLIELVAVIPGLDPVDLGDTPAIGIYSTSYALRGVPVDRSLRLRVSPDRAASAVGDIAPGATGLQVLTCLPEIDALTFTEADFNRRLTLLSGSWCQITDTAIAGWVPGRYLLPE